MTTQQTEWEIRSNKLESNFWKEKAFSIAFTVLALLNQKGMSKLDLAQKMNVKPQYVSRIVKGKANITLETLSRLENALNTELVYILDPTEEVACLPYGIINCNWEDVFNNNDSFETIPQASLTSESQNDPNAEAA